ncbi:unnamed protein product, partial [marine sediment metagenome]
TVAPGAFAVLKPEAFQPRVLILGLAIENLAEFFFLVELADGNGEMLVIAGFSHHKGEAGLLNRVPQYFSFFD